MTLVPLAISAFALILQEKYRYNRGVRNCYRMHYYLLPTISTTVMSCFRCRDLTDANGGQEYLAIGELGFGGIDGHR